jgi:hypothetical protein
MSSVAVGRQWVTARVASAGVVDAAGLLTIVAVLGWVDGLVGVGVGILIAVAWLTLPTLYAVAVGHLVLLVVSLDQLSVVVLGGLEAGFAALLIGSQSSSMSRRRSIGWVLLTGAALGGLVWGLQQVSGSRWLALVVATLVTAATAYALHRYALLRAFTGGTQ